MQMVTIVTRERTRDGEERPLESIELWLALGGMEALQTGQITPARFNELVLTTPLIDGVIALFNEISMEVPE